ncbi:MAG: hypothetical protein HYW22_00070 [Candidatus Aenigmarchaeota archaeon]|nr:hypothetical protein [Candidatus Aenigmarchaeota archaeon]
MKLVDKLFDVGKIAIIGSVVACSPVQDNPAFRTNNPYRPQPPAVVSTFTPTSQPTSQPVVVRTNPPTPAPTQNVVPRRNMLASPVDDVIDFFNGASSARPRGAVTRYLNNFKPLGIGNIRVPYTVLYSDGYFNYAYTDPGKFKDYEKTLTSSGWSDFKGGYINENGNNWVKFESNRLVNIDDRNAKNLADTYVFLRKSPLTQAEINNLIWAKPWGRVYESSTQGLYITPDFAEFDFSQFTVRIHKSDSSEVSGLRHSPTLESIGGIPRAAFGTSADIYYMKRGGQYTTQTAFLFPDNSSIIIINNWGSQKPNNGTVESALTPYLNRILLER